MNKICTSLEQSKKLIELGIDINTADMFWDTLFAKKPEAQVNNYHFIDEYDDEHRVPAWSLSALLRLIPNFNMFKRTIECRIETTNHLVDKACDPIDAAYEMICWLLENKKL